MISIIIPSYNRAKNLYDCLASVEKQTYQDFEVVLVDDGSKEDMSAVHAEFAKRLGNRLQIIKQANQGSNPSRNNGFATSKGDLVIFLDSDIVMHPRMLEKMESILVRYPEASYAYPSHYFGRKLFRLWPFDASRLKRMPYIHTTALIRRSDFPGFDNAIKRFQDWDLWLTMLERGKVGVWIDEPLFTVAAGGTISDWLPSFAYRLFPFLPAVKKYKAAEAIIRAKHKL